jgi:hypothetical protein
MDPITIAMVAALGSGVLGGTADVGKSLIVDAYGALKDAIKRRCGADSQASTAVAAVEGDPEFEGGHALLSRALTKAGADKDPDLLALAAMLEELVAAQSGGASFIGHVSGGNVVQGGQGHTIAQAGADGIAIGRIDRVRE